MSIIEKGSKAVVRKLKSVTEEKPRCFKDKNAVWWIVVFTAVIASIITMCGFVYTIYTVRQYDLSKKELKVTEQRWKLAEEQWKAYEQQVKAREDANKRTQVFVNVEQVHYKLSSQKNSTYHKFIPLHNPISSQFDHLMDGKDEKHWYIYFNDALINKDQTPAELGLKVGDTLKVVVP